MYCVRIQPEGLSHDAEHDLLAIAELLVLDIYISLIGAEFHCFS